MKKIIIIFFISQLLLSSCFFAYMSPPDCELLNVGLWVDPVDEVEDGYIQVYHKGDRAEFWLTIIPDFDKYKTYRCNARITDELTNDSLVMKFIDEGKGFVKDDHTVSFSFTKDDCTRLTEIESEPYIIRAVIPVEMLESGRNCISGGISTDNGYAYHDHCQIKVVE